jgi:hypothetical protein
MVSKTRTQSSRTRFASGVLAGVAALSLALVPAASAEPKGTPTKCDAGAIKEVTVSSNGTSTTTKYVCDKKGNWHKVVNLVANTSRGGVANAGTTAVRS